MKKVFFCFGLLCAPSAFANEVCFTDSFLPTDNSYQPLSAETYVSCELRDAFAKALYGTSVVLKGAGYACKFAPHPGLQVSANLVDLSAYIVGTIAFTWSHTPCDRPDDETKGQALESACIELSGRGIPCVGISLE